MSDFIDKVYSPAEIAAFKAGVDSAVAVIMAQFPVLTPTEKKKLMSAHRERAEFLPASYNVADNSPGILTDAYNHSHHLISNNLVTVNQEFIDYVNEKLLSPLMMTKFVCGDQATAAGRQVMSAAHERSKTDASFLPIWKNLSRLFKKRPVTPPTPPPVA